MAKYSEVQFENLIRNWFVVTLREIIDSVNEYNEINNRDHSNEFYSQNNSYLNQIINILQENIRGVLTTKDSQHQGEQLTELVKEFVEKFHLVSSKVGEYLSSVHLAEEQLENLSEQYQADPEIYKIFELDQQYAMQAVDSLLTLYYMIKITGYEITGLKYNVEKVGKGYSYCGVKILSKFSTDFKCIIDESKIIKLVVDNEPIVTDDQIFYGITGKIVQTEKSVDMNLQGISSENLDQ